MSAEAQTTNGTDCVTLTDDPPAYLFSYNVEPGATPFSAPIITPYGPPSLTVLVTGEAAGVSIDLLQEGFPPGQTFIFNPNQPVTWNNGCGTTIDQPDWISDFDAGDTNITFTVVNPAGTTDPAGLTHPVVAGFIPKILRTFIGGGDPQVIDAPDPTIVNIDPTGG